MQKTTQATDIKIGDNVGYFNCMDEILPAQVSYIYDGEKFGTCQLFITGLKQYFDYPINELITKESMG